MQKVVNRELKKVKKWLDANRLSLNISKTNYVIFHSQSKRINEFIRIKLGSKPLNRAEYIKYLGILVDSTLSWKPQITELSKKLARTTGMFFKIRHYVSSDTLKLLYYSFFYYILYHSFFYSFFLFFYFIWYCSVGLDPPNHLGLSLQIAKESCKSHFIQGYLCSFYSFILQIETAKTI